MLVLDVKSVDDARKMLEELHYKAKLGTYDLVPLTTWLPLESLPATAPMKPVQ